METLDATAADPTPIRVDHEPAPEPAPIWRLTADQFDLARHNGCVTVHNPATGGHRTFRVHTMDTDDDTPIYMRGKRVVGLLVGPDNGHDYQSFGFIEPDGSVQVWRRFRGQGERSQYERFATMLQFPAVYSRKGVEYMIEGRCRRCNRRLSTPQSVTNGIGPRCAERD